MRKVLPALLAFSTIILVFGGCRAPDENAITVTVLADNSSQVMLVQEGITVTDVLRQAAITLNDLDRVNPPGYSQVSDGLTITVVRVVQETLIIQESVPFGSRTAFNEGLPPGEQRLLQAGVNGMAEITYRITYENGVEISRSEVRRVLITPPQDEVIMIGAQSQLPTVTVNGTLVYISGGNAWIIRQNSANRRPLTIEGGLDGRVFDLSDDGRRLLFTRALGDTPDATSGTPSPATPTSPEAPTGDQPFNELWAILDTGDPDSQALRLEISNILYAEWVPGTQRTFVYSTAEPRLGFPGWQANNDLWHAQITDDGKAIRQTLMLEPSSGGIYGWYGTQFAFSPDGVSLAWAQPDAVGVLNPVSAQANDAQRTPTPTPTPRTPPVEAIALPDTYRRQTLITFAPRNAYDFVWVPSLAWSHDGSLLVTTTHGPPLGSEAPEDSPVFNLTALPRDGGYSIDLVDRSGIWTMAQFSPAFAADGTPLEVVIAYVQATEPLNSVVSRYRLFIMDRDGSNERAIFPPADQPGIAPRDVGFVWSPDGRQIALVYQGNIYLVDILTGLAQQLTSGGLSSLPRWAP